MASERQMDEMSDVQGNVCKEKVPEMDPMEIAQILARRKKEEEQKLKMKLKEAVQAQARVLEERALLEAKRKETEQISAEMTKNEQMFRAQLEKEAVQAQVRVLKERALLEAKRKETEQISAEMTKKRVQAHAKLTKIFTSGVDDILPNELENDPMTRKLYQTAILEGKEIDKTIRVMVVGCYGQGKTTVVKRLLDQPVHSVESTNGIEIHRCKIAEEGAKWETQTSSAEDNDTMKRLARLVKTESELTTETADLDKSTDILNNIKFNLNKDQHAIQGPSSTKKDTGIDVEMSKDIQKFKHCLKERKETDNSNVNTEYVNVWDFGGQYIFYATHQLFHSSNAIYLLVFNLNKSLTEKVKDEDFPGKKNLQMKSMKEYIEFWVSSIHSFVGSEDGSAPPIILVGTHKDEIQDDSQADEYFNLVRELFDGRKLLFHIQPESYAISAMDLGDKTPLYLRKAITLLGKKEANKHVIPARWIPLEKALKDIQGENITTFGKVLQMNSKLDYPIKDEDEVKLFLNYHHARGTFFYFDEGGASDCVILNPQYIINAFKCVITSRKFCLELPSLRPLWKRLSEKAILEPKLLESVWENDSESQFMKFKDVLIFFLKKHRIIAEAHEYKEVDGTIQLKPLGFYIVPSLMSTSNDDVVEDFLIGKQCTQVSLVYEFENEAIVPTIFQRLTAAAIGTWPIICVGGQDILFENVGAYKLDMTDCGLIMKTNNKIELLVVQQCPERGVLRETPHFFRRFVELMIGQEFMKFRDKSGDQARQSYRQLVRCFHQYHRTKGSIALYDLEELKTNPEKIVCCPDNLKHESLCIAQILQLWFDQNLTRGIPKRKLSKKEFSELSRAIGYEWCQLGLNLGVDDITIQHIEMDNPRTSMRIYELLLKWDSENSEEATLDVLIDAILKLPANTVNWDIVNNLVDNLYGAKK